MTFIRYDDATGDQHVATWPPAREYIRRGTSATSVGDPEPVSNILVAGYPRRRGAPAACVQSLGLSTVRDVSGPLNQ